ncbi:hypothetical protein SAMN04487969_112157 [Paenibacillus algorifonticola]|uniref:Matrixin n=1 Tax=Paenibacillus algorifonticola TaxID=684063 RepID=A0A1I2FKY5_9BACL|nr:hypothetical protein [Paenibacillus algorifonticola]SFF05955.1 hypothetical protein SAMN04487969_112157 [Paenibacillus algorifonticola]
MKNHKMRYVYSMTLSFLAVFLFGSVVSADYFSGNRKNGAKPLAYYHSSVADNGYTSHYDAGRAYWNGNSKVNIVKTETNSVVSRPDVYYIGNTSIAGFFGQTIAYTSSGDITTADSYWDYTTVFMYDNTMRAKGSDYSAPTVKYNAAHEIGHSIKMAHVPFPYNSVMVQGWRSVPSAITTYDSEQVDSKWASFP